VVDGGSLAGMLAARVLSDHFERVTLLERDRFPETPVPARGCRRAGTRTACWSAAAGPWSGSSRA
jgi:2-polyprenyl-6-methoxyphenol hydroxylase-like FAD-dependent oxidoreductase